MIEQPAAGEHEFPGLAAIRKILTADVAGLVVAKSRAPVIPMRLFGAYEALPYGASTPRFTTVTAVVGQPLTFPEQDFPSTREGYQAISDAIMASIASIECPPDRLP